MYRTGIRPFASVGLKNVPSGLGTIKNCRNPRTVIGAAVFVANVSTIATVMILRPLPAYALYGGASLATASGSGRNAGESAPKSVTVVVHDVGVDVLSIRE